MSKTFYIVAGETSGDKIGAHLASLIQENYPRASLRGMGGRCMHQVGVSLDFDISHFAMFGFKDILLKLRSMLSLRRDILNKIKQVKADLVILIDYPGLNLSLLRTLDQLDIKTVYYVCPKVWASREYRIKRLQQSNSTLWSILPFESDYFEKFDLKTYYLGHPLLDAISCRPQRHHKIQKVVLMPGSRVSEIKKHAPIMIEAVRCLHSLYQLEFSIAMANVRHNELLCQVFSSLIAEGLVYIKPGNTAEEQADYAIAASGTVTLELAKRMIPMCVVYKLDRFSYWLATKIVDVPYISLCNLILDRAMVPEFIQNDASAKAIVDEFTRVYTDKNYHQAMMRGMQEVVDTVGQFNTQRVLASIDSLV